MQLVGIILNNVDLAYTLFLQISQPVVRCQFWLPFSRLMSKQESSK